MQGPRNLELQFSEGGGINNKMNLPSRQNGLISGRPNENVNTELKNETQRQLRLEIVESILEHRQNKFNTVSVDVDGNNYVLDLTMTGNVDMPYKLDIRVVSKDSNEFYSVYISKNGEYLQKELISSIINRTQYSLQNEGYEIDTKPEEYTQLDIETSLIDDILLKFW